MAKIIGPLTIEFDAAVRESHGGSTTPTDHPVETGAVVSDHAIDQPDTLELAGMISNTPILALASERSRSVLGGPASSRANDAYEEIVRLRKTKTLVTVETELRTYESMLIVSEAVTREKDTGQILDVVVGFREYRTATVESAPAPTPVSTVDAPEPDGGLKQTAPAAPEVEEKSGTLLEKTATAVGEWWQS